MKFNKFSFKILILFTIFCFITLPTFSYADDTPSKSFDYLYNYKVIKSSLLDDVLSEALNSDYVFSGNYYYFAFLARNFNDNTVSPKVFFVWKSGLKSFTLKPEFILCDGYYSFNFQWNVDKSGDWQNCNSNYDGFINRTSFFVANCYPVGLWDSNVRTFTIPFYTNYPNDINLTFSNSSTSVLVHSTPYISDDDKTIANMSGSYFLINPGNSSVKSLHFSLCQTVVEDLGDGMQYEKELVLKDIVLDTSPPYYTSPTGDDYWWEVPYSSFFGLSLKAGEIYNWRLQFDNGSDTIYVDRKIKSNVDYVFSAPTGDDGSESGDNENESSSVENVINDSTNAIIDSNKETQNAINNQTQAIQENTATNKGIWDTLKEVVSYLNPFSENFFVYKLIDLLIDGLKSLFIPSDDFFSTYFEDLRDWFSDRLGFLWTPFDVIIEILENISSIMFGEPVVCCFDIYEPFTNTKIISAFSYNLNNLLENSTFKTVHDIYFVVVDAIIIFAMIHLTHKKIEEVFSN